MYTSGSILRGYHVKKLFARYANSKITDILSTKRIGAQLKRVIPSIPAYCDFLSQHGMNPHSIQSLELTQLPITHKSNYIQKYPLAALCTNGTLEDKYGLETSSGYSGEEQYWARNDYEQRTFTQYLEACTQKFLNIDSKSTLLIVCWALGTWVTGESFAHAARLIACKPHNKLTVITPGNNFNTVVNILRKFYGLYDQTVIAGYPFFIKNLLLKGKELGIDWGRSLYHIIAGGEGFPEDMRDFFAQQLNSPINTKGKSLITSAYGSADTGIGVGHETPLSILVRRLAKSDPRLASTLFGTSAHNLPMLFQYNPLNYYIENVDDEVIVTAPFNGIPLIRYNLHDNGGIIRFDDLQTILRERGHDIKAQLKNLGYDSSDLWRLPLLYIFGRSDGTITYNGANIYLENIKEAMALPEIVHTNTGQFTLSRILVENFEPKIKIVVELSHGVEISEQLHTKYEVAVISTLSRVNKEYRDQLDKLHEKATPLIEFTYPAKPPTEAQIKHKYL